MHNIIVLVVSARHLVIEVDIFGEIQGQILRREPHPVVRV